MTNTHITDPEVLEQHLPGLRLRRFAVRRDSGGDGCYRGGDGLVRECEPLAPATLTLVTQRRLHAPFGLAGDAGDQTGSTLPQRAGDYKTLPPGGI